MLSLSLSDKFCCFGIFVFIFNRFLFSCFSFVLVLVFINEFVIFSFFTILFSFSLTKITLCLCRNLITELILKLGDNDTYVYSNKYVVLCQNVLIRQKIVVDDRHFQLKSGKETAGGLCETDAGEVQE